MAGLTVGFAAGTTTAGLVIDARGASAAYGVLSLCAVLAALLTAVGVRHLGRALAAADRQRELEAADDPAAVPGSEGPAPA
jgi:high-affinity Fe2+/Pb2+ permease